MTKVVVPKRSTHLYVPLLFCLLLLHSYTIHRVKDFSVILIPLTLLSSDRLTNKNLPRAATARGGMKNSTCPGGTFYELPSKERLTLQQIRATIHVGHRTP